jgi:hypothetical protein
MVLRIPGLLEDPAPGAYDDGVCGNDEGRLALVLVVDLARVDLAALLRGGLEDVLVRRERLGEVFLERGRDDVDMVEAELRASAGADGAGRSRLTMLSSCFLRGDADASTTRFCRSWTRAGRSSGSRGGGLRGERNGSGGALAWAPVLACMGGGVLRSAS